MHPNTDAPDGGDLIAAIAATLSRCRAAPDDVAREARTHGVSVDTWEAALIASVVSDWLATESRPVGLEPVIGGDRTRAIEATRGSLAAVAGRPVALAVRVPPLLALRLVELAGINQTTPAEAARLVLARHTDAEYALGCRAHNRPDPRPWNGGTAHGS